MLEFLRLVFGAILLAVRVRYPDLIHDLVRENITVLSPGQVGYADASTPFNLRFVFKPAAIIFPNNAEDVSTAIKIAQRYHHQIVARSGGHSYIANGLGGKDGVVVVDMRNFIHLSVDPSTLIATIGPGNRLGDVVLGLNKVGRAIPHGSCPYVGFGGFSGNGGFGFMSRKWGLTLDKIQSLEVVLANGTIVVVTATNYPDLFFALRGSSGSFGIVTSIQVNTHAVPPSITIFEYHWDLSAADAANAAEQFQNFVQTDIPQELGGQLIITKGSSWGRVNVGLIGGWYAPADQFASVIAPFLAKLPAPLERSLNPGPYIDGVKILGRLGRLNTTGIPDSTDTFYAKSIMTPEASPMSTTALHAFMDYLGDEGFMATNADWFVEIELYGGTNSAINKVALDATSFAHRSSTFTVQFYTRTIRKVPPFPQESFSFLDGMVASIVDNQPADWDYGAYPNYIDDRLENWQHLYYGSHYNRLRSLKNQYDPNNIFNFPFSIEE